MRKRGNYPKNYGALLKTLAISEKRYLFFASPNWVCLDCGLFIAVLFDSQMCCKKTSFMHNETVISWTSQQSCYATLLLWCLACLAIAPRLKMVALGLSTIQLLCAGMKCSDFWVVHATQWLMNYSACT